MQKRIVCKKSIFIICCLVLFFSQIESWCVDPGVSDVHRKRQILLCERQAGKGTEKDWKLYVLFFENGRYAEKQMGTVWQL